MVGYGIGLTKEWIGITRKENEPSEDRRDVTMKEETIRAMMKAIEELLTIVEKRWEGHPDFGVLNKSHNSKIDFAIEVLRQARLEEM